MEAPKTPVQWFAVVAGLALAACGVLAFAYGALGFGTVGQGDGDELGIWRVSGWEAVL